jgi:uncharacterized protein (TIGR00106 family)
MLPLAFSRRKRSLLHPGDGSGQPDYAGPGRIEHRQNAHRATMNAHGAAVTSIFGPSGARDKSFLMCFRGAVHSSGIPRVKKTTITDGKPLFEVVSLAPMLFELTLIPLGVGTHLSNEIAEALKVVDASGLPYQLTPTGTCIEGEWNEVMGVIHQCHDRLREKSSHLITLIKIEDESGATDKLRRNVASVEQKVGHALKVVTS